jgi:hypothetical protein
MFVALLLICVILRQITGMFYERKEAEHTTVLKGSSSRFMQSWVLGFTLPLNYYNDLRQVA